MKPLLLTLAMLFQRLHRACGGFFIVLWPQMWIFVFRKLS